jgi:hypothetical protein
MKPNGKKTKIQTILAAADKNLKIHTDTKSLMMNLKCSKQAETIKNDFLL